MQGKRKVKTRTLENHKGAAPKFVLAFQGCATRHPNSSQRVKGAPLLSDHSSLVKRPGTRRNDGRRKSPRAKPARGAPGENVGAPTFKVLLEGLLYS
jgi:hypothetical protein